MRLTDCWLLPLTPYCFLLRCYTYLALTYRLLLRCFTYLALAYSTPLSVFDCLLLRYYKYLALTCRELLTAPLTVSDFPFWATILSFWLLQGNHITALTNLPSSLSTTCPPDFSNIDASRPRTHPSLEIIPGLCLDHHLLVVGEQLGVTYPNASS